MTARLSVCVFVLACHPSVAIAQDTQDGQLWLQALAIGRLSENWRAHLELQPRVFRNVSELGLTIVRTAVGRQVAPRVTLWAGHAWVPRSLGPATVHETRSWQQVSLIYPSAGRWVATGRFRLEQRWLDPWEGASHRLRVMTRVQRPLTPSWSVAAYDEMMFTLDTTRRGPARGYDRNRLWGGLARRLSPTVSAEFGYMWENSTLPGPLQRNEHVALGVLNVAFSRR